MVKAAKKHGVGVKVIFETCELTEEEIRRGTEICIEAGADFVKTSTGFAASGASEEAVTTMLDEAKGRIKVKPSGLVFAITRPQRSMWTMGASRLGIGFGTALKICEGEKEAEK